MLKVLEAVNKCTDYLQQKGIESARLNSELMLADVLKCKRLELYLNFERPLSDIEIDIFREYMVRRGKFEPLQYILGNVEFFGYEFKVNPSVLIPRPETEILVEKVIEIESDKLKILDIGTGSGIIPISLALNFKESDFIGIDISDDALEVAKENGENHNVSERIKFINKDILNDNNLGNLGKFDVIISNPPYVKEDEYNTLQKEITEFEPKIAVTDFSDGFKFYKRIIELSDKLLTEKGRVYFEIGIGQFEKIESILVQNSFSNIEIIKDYSNIERVITGVYK